MAAVTSTTEPDNGRLALSRSGFSYLPHFIEQDEADELIRYFSRLTPIWEHRHSVEKSSRSPAQDRRLTRPVYWLGAWQFAVWGYYAEPHYREARCLRAEPLQPVMQRILERLKPILWEQHAVAPKQEIVQALPNTCLINYYGRQMGGRVPVDSARLRMHRDGEPGPVVMFNIGQAGLLEFVDPERSPEPELGVWTRHRSVTILSGPDFKDRLYHRVSKVRTGAQPALSTTLADFELRRVSVSFRSVPAGLIQDFNEFSPEKQEQVSGYLTQLAGSSAHFAKQLALGPPERSYRERVARPKAAS